MKESSERQIVIEGFDIRTVQAMVNYIYGFVDQHFLGGEEQTTSLLRLAHYYQITSLVDICVGELSSGLSIDTVADVLQVADLVDVRALRTACLEFMSRHIEDVQATESYARLVAKRPALLADMLEVAHPPTKRRRVQGA